jgi:hypothetical protein
LEHRELPSFISELTSFEMDLGAAFSARFKSEQFSRFPHFSKYFTPTRSCSFNTAKPDVTRSAHKYAFEITGTYFLTSSEEKP